MSPTALHARVGSVLLDLLPGLLLVALITAASFGLRGLPWLAGLSPVILAILLGMFFTNVVGVTAPSLPGITFASRTLLRFAVALLGAQVTLAELTAFGWAGAVGLVATVVLTLGFAYMAGRALGIERDLSMLVATGTAICGASAIAGANAILRAREEFVTYAVAVITIWGTIGLFGLPLLQGALGLSDVQLGLWAGLSLHEVAQAVGAGFAVGDISGQAAVAMKLGRVLMLAAVIFGLARLWHGPEAAGGQRAGIPGFVLMFLALAALNSFGLLPEQARLVSATLTPIMLAAALAGLGLATRFDKLRVLGVKPLIQGGIAFAFIAITGLGVAAWIG